MLVKLVSGSLLKQSPTKPPSICQCLLHPSSSTPLSPSLLQVGNTNTNIHHITKPALYLAVGPTPSLLRLVSFTHLPVNGLPHIVPILTKWTSSSFPFPHFSFTKTGYYMVNIYLALLVEPYFPCEQRSTCPFITPYPYSPRSRC